MSQPKNEASKERIISRPSVKCRATRGERNRRKNRGPAHQSKSLSLVAIQVQRNNRGANLGRLLRILPRRWAGSIKVHHRFSGKKERPRPRPRRRRVRNSPIPKGSSGRARSTSWRRIAMAAMSCHKRPRQRGGHRAGSDFELVSWSQARCSTTLRTSNGKDNVPASTARKRNTLSRRPRRQLETALRAVDKATIRKPYAFEMAARADRARKQLAAAAKQRRSVQENSQRWSNLPIRPG